MIHPSQLQITTPPRIIGGQQVGVPRPSVTVTHTPTGNSVTIKDGRSQAHCRRVAEIALEMALLEMGWKTLEMEIEI